MESRQPILIAVPNVSEGVDRARLAAIGAAFGPGARLLDTHSDPDHGRSAVAATVAIGALLLFGVVVAPAMRARADAWAAEPTTATVP